MNGFYFIVEEILFNQQNSAKILRVAFGRDLFWENSSSTKLFNFIRHSWPHILPSLALSLILLEYCHP